MSLTVHQGHVLETLPLVPTASVQCVVTSPPYWGLRDYGTAPVEFPAVSYSPLAGLPEISIPAESASLGLESSLESFIGHLVLVFRELKRVLKPDGVAWANMGDGYSTKRAKDLLGQPWRLALALQADGWTLRQDIIWHKPNPMPESVTDRCTKAHEYIFLLSKGPRYFWDKSAMSEKCSLGTNPRSAGNRGWKSPDGWDTGSGSHGSFHKGGREKGKTPGQNSRIHVTRTPNGSDPQDRKFGTLGVEKNNASMDSALAIMPMFRNKRSVWSIPTQGFKGAHFATFPAALVAPCILSSSRPGDTVLDPFGGSFTTAQVALAHGRHAVMHELNPDYVAIGESRAAQPIKSPTKRTQKPIPSHPELFKL